MKRVFIAGITDDREKTLEFIRDTGVLHVEPVKKLTGETESRNTALVQEMRRVLQIYNTVRTFTGRKKNVYVALPDDEVLPYCERQLSALQEVRTRRMFLERARTEMLPWGDFDPSVISALEKEGVCLQRFKADKAGIGEGQTFPDGIFVQIVAQKPAMLFFTISLNGYIDLPWATQLKLPEKGLTDTIREIDILDVNEQRILEELAGMGDRLVILKKLYINLLNEANYTECFGTMYEEDLLFGLQGWIPVNIEEDFYRQVGDRGLSITVTTREPLENETPPVLLKNNRFFMKIEPLMKLYGLPDYRSIDPSYFFAPFMILFFGICLGDAGYGAVFWLASFLIGKRFGRYNENLPLIMKLCQAFSIAAIVIGVVTGSVFGYNFASRQWILVDLHQDFGNPMILFYASLGLGVIHLSLSYTLGIIQGISRIDRLQKAGLLGVLWGGVLLISRTIWFSDPSSPLGLPIYYGGLAFLFTGILLILFFSSQDKNWLVRLGLGLYGVYGLTGLVGDLLSYARLFGLGIATTAIASVMNDLAGMVYNATGHIAGAILAVIIVVFGHTFNLALSILGSVVHSARLHFVEAFKSFYRGGGTEYKPFKTERGS